MAQTVSTILEMKTYYRINKKWTGTVIVFNKLYRMITVQIKKSDLRKTFLTFRVL